MVSSTLSSTDVYIVVLDVEADSVRALLFDAGARRVEGYSAQLPRRTGAAADCLDEMHRLVESAGCRVAGVVGRAESEVTPEDRKYWPAFEHARWFPPLPPGAGAMLGCGCLGRIGLGIGAISLMGAVLPAPMTAEGLCCARIDEKRWLLSCAVPEAGGAYAAVKHELRVKGSVEGYLETAGKDDPHLAALASIEERFRQIYEALARAWNGPAEVAGCGAMLLKSPAWSQRIARALGVPLALCTEPEPGCRGSALWALERVGAIEDLESLRASMGAVFR